MSDKQYLNNDELGFLSREILILLQSNEPYDPWGISVPSRPSSRTPSNAGSPITSNRKTLKASPHKSAYSNPRMNDINIEPSGNYILSIYICR